MSLRVAEKGARKEATCGLQAIRFIRKVAETKEFAEGNAFADYGQPGELLRIEFLAPCHSTVLEKIARKQPEIQKFIRTSIPRQWLWHHESVFVG